MTLNVPGAEAVVSWFGEWPTFHDAEILTLHIDRELKESFLGVRTFTRTNRIDANGRFLRHRDAILVFEFAGIRSVNLRGEDADVQNVIGGMLIDEINVGYRMLLSPCYGLGGEIIVAELTVRIESTLEGSESESSS